MLLNKVYQHQRTPMQYAYRLFFLLLRNQVGFEFSNQSSRPFVSEQYEIINAIIEPSRHHDILFSMGHGRLAIPITGYRLSPVIIQKGRLYSFCHCLARED